MAVDIEEGDIRFMVGFEDADLRIPVVQKLRFLHKRQSDSGERLLIFTEIHSATKGEKLFVRESDFDELILDKKRLLDVLQRSFDGNLAKWRPIGA